MVEIFSSDGNSGGGSRGSDFDWRLLAMVELRWWLLRVTGSTGSSERSLAIAISPLFPLLSRMFSSGGDSSGGRWIGNDEILGAGGDDSLMIEMMAHRRVRLSWAPIRSVDQSTESAQQRRMRVFNARLFPNLRPSKNPSNMRARKWEEVREAREEEESNVDGAQLRGAGLDCRGEGARAVHRVSDRPSGEASGTTMVAVSNELQPPLIRDDGSSYFLRPMACSTARRRQQ
nr:hypothetical protein Iba_chr01aCG7510 [Ipomoea batatas]